MNTSYIYLLIFACIAYLIVTDPSISRLFALITQLLKFQFEKTKWIILNDPRNPIVRWIMWRRAYKLAKEMQKEFEDNSK